MGTNIKSNIFFRVLFFVFFTERKYFYKLQRIILLSTCLAYCFASSRWGSKSMKSQVLIYAQVKLCKYLHCGR